MNVETRRPLIAVALAMAAPLACAQEAPCVRGEPEPLLPARTAGVAQARFERLNAHEAVEDVTLTQGERLRFEHGGCEYYVVTFTIHARGARLQAAARSLRQLARLKASSGFNLAAAAAAMERLQRAGKLAVDGEEYPVAGDGEDFLQTRFVFTAAARGAVRFSLLTGPL